VAGPRAGSCQGGSSVGRDAGWLGSAATTAATLVSAVTGVVVGSLAVRRRWPSPGVGMSDRCAGNTEAEHGEGDKDHDFHADPLGRMGLAVRR
jgi:hypothetical protein